MDLRRRKIGKTMQERYTESSCGVSEYSRICIVFKPVHKSLINKIAILVRAYKHSDDRRTG